MELRARIVAFAPAAAEATSKIARKIPTVQDVRHLAAFEKTVAPLDGLAGREVEWAYGNDRIGASGVATCALFVVWWNTTGAGSAGSLDAYQGATSAMKNESLYFGAISDVILGTATQRKLDSALAELATLNEQVATLAVEVRNAADPCSITTLP